MSDCRCSGAPGQNDTWDYHSDYCPVYMQGRIVELEADRSKAWETCQKAVERGMALEAELAKLREELIAQEIEQENEALRDMLQTAWNMSDAEFEEALPEEGK